MFCDSFVADKRGGLDEGKVKIPHELSMKLDDYFGLDDSEWLIQDQLTTRDKPQRNLVRDSVPETAEKGINHQWPQ